MILSLLTSLTKAEAQTRQATRLSAFEGAWHRGLAGSAVAYAPAFTSLFGGNLGFEPKPGCRMHAVAPLSIFDRSIQQEGQP